jgi:hypothetical protein
MGGYLSRLAMILTIEKKQQTGLAGAVCSENEDHFTSLEIKLMRSSWSGEAKIERHGRL